MLTDNFYFQPQINVYVFFPYFSIKPTPSRPQPRSPDLFMIDVFPLTYSYKVVYIIVKTTKDTIHSTSVPILRL